MRYIIIPLAIILYIWGAGCALKDIKNNFHNPGYYRKDSTNIWLIFNVDILIIIISWFSIKHW